MRGARPRRPPPPPPRPATNGGRRPRPRAARSALVIVTREFAAVTTLEGVAARDTVGILLSLHRMYAKITHAISYLERGCAPRLTVGHAFHCLNIFQCSA
ncbi:hypothetical protein EVAR_60498_1 [Eumeta japonica]|uniref:Uncharacterized protein n=1 Tax=Eumeta variegata TaxID=151549 RepID=A0A4C1ZIX3_EUMVA|nr:hypothetical protein EVAR_60498_1 [Eumeta japonica]